jgi:hypothetical protein
LAQVFGGAAHDGAVSGNPVLTAGYASAAAPTDVSADGDAVRAWFLRNGAQATVITAAGALVGGDATNGLDVDVTRVIPGTTATALGKAEDAGHTTGDTGVMALAVRNDAGTALAGTDLDYIPLSTDNTGALRVTGGGGGTQYTEDAAAAADPVGNAVILVRKDTPAATVSADGDNIAQRGSNYGAAYVTLLDSAGSFVSVGGGTQYDEDTAHVSGDKLTMAGVVRKDTAASLCDTDGDRSALIVDSTGKLHVNVGNTVTVGSHAVTNAGTFVVQENGAALTQLQILDDVIYQEDAAAANLDKGVFILGVRRDTAASSSGTDGDYSSLNLDNAGRLWASAKIDTALPAGSNTIGDVTISGAALTSLQLIDDAIYAEDAASANADKGVMVLAKRLDTPANSSGTDGDYEPLQVSAGRVWASAKIDTAIPAGTNLIGNVGHGKTCKVKTGSASATFTIVAAVTSKKIKVYALSLMTSSTTAVTVTFKDGASGTAIGTYPLQAISGTVQGIAESVDIPSSLFETSSGTLLEMSFSAAVSVTYNLRYWDDD